MLLLKDKLEGSMHQLVHLMQENSLLEAGDPVKLSSVVEFDKCVMQDNSFSDDSNNVMTGSFRICIYSGDLLSTINIYKVET